MRFYDEGGDGWNHGYHEGDRYGGGRSFNSEGRFPYRTLRIIAWSMFVLAIIVLMLGVIDVGWTAGSYVGDNCQLQAWTPSQTPCDHDNLIWTWVAAPIWASLFVMITGIVGTRFSRWRSTNLKFHRDMFAVLCLLVVLLWSPIIIVIDSLEIFNGLDIFYYMDTAGQMQFGDEAKIVLPLLIILLAFVIWIIAIIGLSISLCCAPVMEEGQQEPQYAPHRTMRSHMTAPPMMSGVYPTRPTPVAPPVMLNPASYYPYAYGQYSQYPTFGGYNTYKPQTTGGSASVYGGYGAGAMMPYAQPYGTYGGYTNRAIASNPYI